VLSREVIGASHYVQNHQGAVFSVESVFALANTFFVAFSVVCTIVQAEYFRAIVSSPLLFLEAFAIREREILNALSDRVFVWFVSAIIFAAPYRAIFSVEVVGVPICVLAFTLTSFSVAKSILTAVRAILNLKSVNIYVAKRIRAIWFVTRIPMPTITASAPRG